MQYLVGDFVRPKMDEIRRFRAHFADVDGKEMRSRVQRPQNHSPKSQHYSHSYCPVPQGAAVTKESLMASQEMGIKWTRRS
jgi:hypothetical protein